MKVELEKVRLIISPLTQECLIGVPSKDEVTFKNKVNIHNDFIHAVVFCWRGKKQIVNNGDGYEYEISVKMTKLPKTKNQQ